MANTVLLNSLLEQIAAHMRDLNMWDTHPPEPEAFMSSVPFFADCMSFPQWLQWVFIPRFNALLEGSHPLPPECAIHPMAEEAFKELSQDTAALLSLLKRFDTAVTAG